VVCPECHSTHCTRSRRKGAADYAISVTQLRPWRCRSCQNRFYAWYVPIALIWYAHCPQCGGFALEKIPGRLALDGHLKWLKRILGFAAYRCPACRERFFSGLLYHPMPSPRESKLASQSPSD
jgi:transposase-like protein